MPELPEVQTIVSDLNKSILGLKIEDVWSDASKIIKKPENFPDFKKEIIGKKIEKVERRAKNILFKLSEGKTLLAHQKMTGHFLYGEWKMVGGRWLSKVRGPLDDPMNRFVHLIFFLNNKRQLALSDLRKFAKIELWDTKELESSKEFNLIGLEPLDKKFTFNKFIEILENKKGKIKQILMDQSVIAGIGNIYSDEILWRSKIHPLRLAQGLTNKEFKKIYDSMIVILKEAIKMRGDSMSDYRLISGEKGGYQEVQRVYKQENKKCQRCGGIIKRIKMGSRSARFCQSCQKL